MYYLIYIVTITLYVHKQETLLCFNDIYYMDNIVLLENKPLIESIWQYIWVPRRIFFISSLVKISPKISKHFWRFSEKFKKS